MNASVDRVVPLLWGMAMADAGAWGIRLVRLTDASADVADDATRLGARARSDVVRGRTTTSPWGEMATTLPTTTPEQGSVFDAETTEETPIAPSEPVVTTSKKFVSLKPSAELDRLRAQTPLLEAAAVA